MGSRKPNQQLLSGVMRMGIWTPFSRSPSTIQVMAMAGTLKIVFPSGNDSSKFSSISTTMECNSITLSNRTSASVTLKPEHRTHENFQPMQVREPAAAKGTSV